MGRPERPIDDDDRGLGGFARALRQLRLEAGRPTYEAMARGSSVSRSALAEAAAGRHVPRWRTVEHYVRYCGGDLNQWKKRWETLQAEPRGRTAETESEVTVDESNVPRLTPFRSRRVLLISGAVVLALLLVIAGVTLEGRRQASQPPTEEPAPALADGPGIHCDQIADPAVVIEAFGSDDGDTSVGTFNTMTLFVLRPPRPGATYWLLLHLYRDDGNTIFAKSKLRPTAGRDRAALRFNDAVGSKRDLYVVEADPQTSSALERNLATQYDGGAPRPYSVPAPVVSASCLVEKQRAD